MRLLLVPIRRVEHLSGHVVTEPDLPESFRNRWGQASGLWSGLGSVLVWVHGDDAEIGEWLVERPAAILVGREVRFTAADFAALRRPHRRTQELLDATQEVARRTGQARRDALLRRRDLLAKLSDDSTRPIPDMVGAYREEAAAFEAEYFRRPPGVVALSVLHSDAFTRSNGELNGSTMSDGLGAWGVEATGKIAVASNRAAWSDGNYTAFDTAMAGAARQRVSALCATGSAWWRVHARQQAANKSNSYAMAGAHVGAYSALQVLNSGVTWMSTNLATGTAVSAGATISVDCDGTSISGLVNGSVTLGPVTDSTHASGVGGMHCQPAHDIDDWQVEIDAPTFTGSAAVAAAAATCAGAGTASAPAFSGSAAVATPVTTAAGVGVATPPSFTGTSDAVCAAAVAFGSGLATPPVFSASVALAAEAAACVGAGTASALSAVHMTGALHAIEGFALRAEQGFALHAIEGFALRAEER